MSAPWTPSNGQQKVTIGSSMLRALNARKSGGAPRNTGLVREFYSFRYNFKPPSVDPDQRGRVVVGSNNNVTVERPSSQSSEAHKWIGQETPARDWDCVLIYDEVQKTFVLEKLESGLTLTHQPRTGTNDFTATVESPTKDTTTYDGADDDFEQELLDAAAAGSRADAKGKDDYFEEIMPEDSRREEEEEEEGEVLPSPPRPPPKKQTRVKTTAAPSTGPTKASAKHTKPITTPIPTKASKPPPPPASAPPTRVVKPTPPLPPPPTSAPIPKTQPKSVPLPRGKKHKREPEPAPPASTPHHISDVDEEDLQFGKPTKRARPSSPRSREPGLALPSASTAVFIPPAPVSATPSVSAPEPIEIGSESEDEGGWDEVAAIGKPVDTEDDFDIFGEAAGGADDAEGEGEDIGMEELEWELNKQMNEVEEDEEDEDEDFLAAVVEEVPPTQGRPVSLSEMAHVHGAPYASDDEYSSSEDSDDD